MINATVINNIYKVYKKSPKDISKLGLDIMKDTLSKFHTFNEEVGFLILEDMSEESPFRKIPIQRIYGIVHFDKNVALVLPNCILFFNKEDSGVNIHINVPRLTIWQKIAKLFNRKE